jgi:hypothetical protein
MVSRFSEISASKHETSAKVSGARPEFFAIPKSAVAAAI